MAFRRHPDAFVRAGKLADRPASKSDLLAADSSQARTEVIDTLGRLPDRDYRSLRELWPLLPGVPVDS